MSSNGTVYATAQERLQARLAEPRTAEALERLLDKLDVVAFAVEATDGFLRRSEQVADSLSASIRDLQSVGGGGGSGGVRFVAALPQLAAAGTQMAEVTQKAAFQNLLNSGLLDQLGKPETIAAIQTVLGKLDMAAFALTAVDGFVKRGDEITNSIGESLGDMSKLAQSVDFGKVQQLTALMDLLPKVMESGALEQFPILTEAGSTLLNSGLLEPKLLAALADALKTLVKVLDEAKRVPPKTVNLFGLAGALKDPDTNRAVAFVLEAAKQYGKRLV